MKYYFLEYKQYFKYSYIHILDTSEPPQFRSAGKESCGSEQNGPYLPSEGIAKQSCLQAEMTKISSKNECLRANRY